MMKSSLTVSSRNMATSSGRGGFVGRQPKIASATARIREQNQLPWRPIFRIILLSGTVAGIVWALNSPIFLIRNTQFLGLKSVPEASVRAMLPVAGNIWLYPTHLAIKKVRAVSPLIADVAIYRQPPSTVRLVIAEKVQAIDWVANDQHYIVGLDGSVVSQAQSVLPLPRLVDTANVTPSTNKSVATPGFVHFVQDLSTQYSNVFSEPLDHLEIGQTTFDITVVPKSGPRLILDTNRQAESQLKASKIVLEQHLDQVHEYIDLRVAGKAYYK